MLPGTVSRGFLLCLALVAGAICQAQEGSQPAHGIAEIERAWKDFTTSSSDADWISIESKTNGRYVQCTRMRGYALCEVPIWFKKTPDSPQTVLSEANGSAPVPEIEGAQIRQFVPDSDVPVLKEAIAKAGLKPVDVYNRLVDKDKKQLVGADYAVKFRADFALEDFAASIAAIMTTTWSCKPEDGYVVEAPAAVFVPPAQSTH